MKPRQGRRAVVTAALGEGGSRASYFLALNHAANVSRSASVIPVRFPSGIVRVSIARTLMGCECSATSSGRSSFTPLGASGNDVFDGCSEWHVVHPLSRIAYTCSSLTAELTPAIKAEAAAAQPAAPSARSR